MIKTINRENLNEIQNLSFRTYATRYLDIEDGTNRAIEGLGLPFNKEVPKITKEEVVKDGVVARNEKKSVYYNWISPACRACKKGEKVLLPLYLLSAIKIAISALTRIKKTMEHFE